MSWLQLMLRIASAATARTNITLRILLPGLHLRSHQSNLIDAGAVSDIDCLGHIREIYGRVALDENYAFGACLEDFFQTWAKFGLVSGLA